MGFLAPLANLVISIYNGVIKTKLNKSYSFALSTNINDVKGYDAFTKKWNESIQNALIKDLPFANWRYGAPGRAYQFLSIYNSIGKMIGFVSFRKIVKEGALLTGF